MVKLLSCLPPRVPASLVFAHSSGGTQFKGARVDYQAEHNSPLGREEKHAQADTRQHVACASADLSTCKSWIQATAQPVVVVWAVVMFGGERNDDTEWLTFNSLCSSVACCCSALLGRWAAGSRPGAARPGLRWVMRLDTLFGCFGVFTRLLLFVVVGNYVQLLLYPSIVLGRRGRLNLHSVKSFHCTTLPAFISSLYNIQCIEYCCSFNLSYYFRRVLPSIGWMVWSISISVG